METSKLDFGEALKLNFAPSSWQFHCNGDAIVVSISPLNHPDPLLSVLEKGETVWKAPLTEELMFCLDFYKVQILTQVGDGDRKVRSIIRYFEHLLGEINKNENTGRFL